MSTPSPAKADGGINERVAGASAGRGVLTIATGKRQYIEQAENLARSCRLHNPGLPIAIVTDSTHARLTRLFGRVIPLKPEYGGPFRQKLNVNLYTPFHQTLYIDADCLVCRPLGHLWALLESRHFAIHGEAIAAGDWYTDVARLCARLGVASIPKFNSGLFAFTTCAETDRLLARAREVIDQHEAFGIKRTHDNQCGDEPALSIAMAEASLAAVADDGTGQAGTLDGVNPRLEIDVPRGRCAYISPGKTVRPAVAHFLANGWRRPDYRREAIKTRLAHDYALPKWGTDMAGAVFNTVESARSTARRVKQVLKPSPTPTTPAHTP